MRSGTADTTDYDALRRAFDKSPFAAFLGMKLLDLARGYAKVSLVMDAKYLNWDQRVHGGLVSSLIDQAFGCALNTLDRNYVAVQLSISFMSTLRGDETIVAEGRVVHAGMSLGVAEMTVKNTQGKTIATATGTALGMAK
ncbi:MAG: PaaI family thioesterase [Chloroflexi bacterium]|nr:PaaI family thioesterase [Chloroflexota bacterium]